MASEHLSSVTTRSKRDDTRRVLCAVDLSAGSRRALAYADGLASHYGAELTVLEVSWAGLPPIAYPGSNTSNTPRLLTARGRAALLGELRRFTNRVLSKHVRSRLVLREGAVVPAILAEARDRRVDLLVIGSHGHGRIERWLLGSAVEKVLRKATCPVIVVPARGSRTRTFSKFRAVLCPVDFSPASLAALRRAAEIARESSAELIAAHVVDWSPEGPRPAVIAKDIEAFGEQLIAEGRRQLDDAISKEIGDSSSVRPLIVAGKAHEEIARLAQKLRPDLIVMGAHGRRPFLDAFLGSTTNQVIRQAICPIMVIRP